MWDHNCVLQNLRLRNLHDPNNSDIDHLIEARQLRDLQQQGCRRPSTNCNSGATTVFAPSNGHVHNLIQELHELQTTTGTVEPKEIPLVHVRVESTSQPRKLFFFKKTEEAFLELHEDGCVSHWAVGTNTRRAIDFKPESRGKKRQRPCPRTAQVQNSKAFCTVWTIPPEQDVNRPQDPVSQSTRK